MDDIIRLDDYRRSLTLVINTDDNVVHVVPVLYFEALIRGDKVEPLADPILREIVREWLEIVRSQ